MTSDQTRIVIISVVFVQIATPRNSRGGGIEDVLGVEDALGLEDSF